MTSDDDEKRDMAVRGKPGRQLKKVDVDPREPERPRFALHLRALRERSNRTSDELAAELDIHPGTLSRYLDGKVLPKWSTVKKFQNVVAKYTKLTESDWETSFELYSAAGRKGGPIVSTRVELEQYRETVEQRWMIITVLISRLNKQLDVEQGKLADGQVTIARLEHQISESAGLATELNAARRQLAEERDKSAEHSSRIADLKARLDAANQSAVRLQELVEAISLIVENAAQRDSDVDPELLAELGALLEPLPNLTPTRRTRVWHGVPLRDPGAVARVELLDQLRDRLKPVRGSEEVAPVALCGTSGTGKSHIVKEYFHRHTTDYDIVWWLEAEHPADIRVGLVELANRLGIASRDPDVAIPAVLEALRTGIPFRRWALVFDGANDPTEIHRYLPMGYGHVVLTSSSPAWTDVADVIDVGPFTRDESIHLFRHHLRNIDHVEADKLSETLGDLPAAVAQTAMWMAATGMQSAEFIGLLEDRPDVLDEIAPSPLATLTRGWNIQLARLRHDQPGTFELLGLCTFLEQNPVSRAMFTEVDGVPMSDLLRHLLTDPVRLSAAFRRIRLDGLGTIDPQSGGMSIHRLLRATIRGHLTPREATDLRTTAHALSNRRRR